MNTSWIIGIFAGVVLVALSSCGPLGQDRPAGRFVSGLVGDNSDSPQGAAAGLGSSLTRAQIEAQPVNLLRLSIISREATAILVEGGNNGSKTTWFSPEGLSLTFDNGLLIGTRGFGDDLMGSDVSGAIASLGSGGNHLRTLDFLNGLGQIERVSYRCNTVRTRSATIEIADISYDTTIIEETCASGGHTFKNTYWRDDAGTIWQSRQWISPQVGFLGYQRL